ncbi:hypothetical protein AC629_02635 [Bradyrhizobium sp. NAS80.1]|nr:hypothetical protein AC629_02635 [Bradyrhizobium sp. NAS80.1]
MFEANLARIRTHRNNIHRYRGLLRTELSGLEREFIEKRMADEQTALDALVADFQLPTFPAAPISAPSSISVNLERPRQMAIFPGGGSPALAR